MAGVSVFGLENQGGPTDSSSITGAAGDRLAGEADDLVHRAGDHLGAAGVMAVSSPRMSHRRASEDLLWLALSLPLAFAVAQLCGMAIPRGITAGVDRDGGDDRPGGRTGRPGPGKMMPAWGLAALPVAFLVVTWAWSGDWLLDRPAPGRYLRLGLILAGTFGVLLGGYAGVRVWSIPDPGPIAAPSCLDRRARSPPDRNAADLYREAARLGSSRARSG